ncbi:2,5-diketo-D-gluconate reductase A [Kibdelosporangium banguiense]|uniref:2,5-diketo-D-gluconate reductase A n=1 Tax=Kibdelosporangium banguiense TaxID=1365924 RepID=A0ABS4TSH8_9PSEU|nr:aldo/keto reductase [Kibdelosporangium banguiense]MBP2326873.1 2,5-diketo-D-gluconate reductase A [Kibdelosporangium banguiense]
MIDVPDLPLNDGHTIPQFGLGVWQVPNSGVAAAMNSAFEAGYRSVDTAALYRNEEGVGDAIAASGIPRENLFITTKLWGSDSGYDGAMRGFDESIGKLRLDYVDLYLIHWPGRSGSKYVEAWKALEQLRADGRARSVGVSNFEISHLRRVFDSTGTVPAVNQIELHPEQPETKLRAFHAEHGILTEAYSPLAVGRLVGNRTVGALATKYDRTPAQILLRWNIQLGNRVIPKSVRPHRIRENINVFDFELADDDMATLTSLGGRA